MKRFLVAATAALALAACSDASTNPLTVPTAPEAGPRLATAPVGTRWSIFTSQLPDQTGDAAPGWEVATQFRTSKAGKVVGFRFYRAAGETGINTAKLWTNSGTFLASATFASGSSGWQTVYLPTTQAVSLSLNTNYRVSVNTNTKQAKYGGGFYFDGPITRGPLTADAGFYGQPTGSMPTSGSTSMFFVDVIFEEDVPLPNLYVGSIQVGLANSYGDEIVQLVICNTGPGAAGASYTRLQHNITPNIGGSYTDSDRWLSTPAIAAGSCTNLQPVTISRIASKNEYRVWADAYDFVYESNETDNFLSYTWYR